ncbi:fimbrial protein [Salmonella enterica]|nr:fimbrial protein [Salmonella enterica]
MADVDGGSGKITFTGDVIAAPCAIKAEDVDKQVDLGEVPASYINSQGHSDAVDSSIHLVDCDLPNSDNGQGSTITKVDVTFTSSAVTTEGESLLSNTMTGGATGVGVRLLDGTGQNITLSTPKEITLVQASSEQTLPFQAYMELVDGTKATPATPGAVASNATYVLSYK